MLGLQCAPETATWQPLAGVGGRRIEAGVRCGGYLYGYVCMCVYGYMGWLGGDWRSGIGRGWMSAEREMQSEARSEARSEMGLASRRKVHRYGKAVAGYMARLAGGSHTCSVLCDNYAAAPDTTPSPRAKGKGPSETGRANRDCAGGARWQVGTFRSLGEAELLDQLDGELVGAKVEVFLYLFTGVFPRQRTGRLGSGCSVECMRAFPVCCHWCHDAEQDPPPWLRRGDARARVRKER